MSQQVDTGCRTYIADAAITQFARVVFEADGRVVTAGAGSIGDGVAQTPAIAAGDAIAVKVWNSAGTFKMIADEAVSVAADLSPGASGKVADTAEAGVGAFAKALEAATADGDIIECELLPSGGGGVAGQSITADDSDSALNTVLPGTTSVTVAGVTNGATDYVVLPSLASVPNGHRVAVIGSASSNFEVRTPATSAEEINSEDCDGTKEYLFTDTQIHYFTKINNTVGWMGNGYSAIGAVVTAVIPD